MSAHDFLDDYQDFMWKWHKAKYPDATAYRIALKGAEEFGEVAEVVVKHQSSDRLVEEVGDVLNVLVTLLSLHGRRLSEAIDYARTIPVIKGWVDD